MPFCNMGCIEMGMKVSKIWLIGSYERVMGSVSSAKGNKKNPAAITYAVISKMSGRLALLGQPGIPTHSYKNNV